MGKFVVKKTAIGFTWSLKAGNGEVIAIGGEVFSSLDSAKTAVQVLQRTHLPLILKTRRSRISRPQSARSLKCTPTKKVKHVSA